MTDAQARRLDLGAQAIGMLKTLSATTFNTSALREQMLKMIRDWEDTFAQPEQTP